MPTPDRHVYQREYHRIYGRTPARREYLNRKQREYRGTEPKADAAVQRVYRPDDSAIRRMSDYLCERGGA